ncbi:hypothetical protein CEXT_96941 [Caerostris extrusa]|uniref:Uncharacterized protein n=1 Tax=Caerostris extrusa TaxID=172846 RepID=A0AAV4NPZ2_CAEEX|nr:hypothetical protein CEXT_96941 [Caerostris extrusa]
MRMSDTAPDTRTAGSHPCLWNRKGVSRDLDSARSDTLNGTGTLSLSAQVLHGKSHSICAEVDHVQELDLKRLFIVVSNGFHKAEMDTLL